MLQFSRTLQIGQSRASVDAEAREDGFLILPGNDAGTTHHYLYRSAEWMSNPGIGSSSNLPVYFGRDDRVVKIGTPRSYVTDAM